MQNGGFSTAVVNRSQNCRLVSRSVPLPFTAFIACCLRFRAPAPADGHAPANADRMGRKFRRPDTVMGYRCSTAGGVDKGHQIALRAKLSQTGPHGGLQAVLGPLGRSLGAVRRYRRPAIADDGRPLWRVGVHKTPACPHNRYVNAHWRIWAEVCRGTARHMQPGGDGAPGRRCGWDVMVRAWALHRGCSCLIVLLASGSANTYKPK